MPGPTFQELRGQTPRQRLVNETMDKITPGAKHELKSHKHGRAKDQINWQAPRMCAQDEEEEEAEP